MERKIGEIFEYNGEWYQCVEDTTDDNCNNCCFQKSCNYFVGDCSSTIRSDGKTAAFKKLEKVGEPYEFDGYLFQSYRTFEVPIFTENYATVREFSNNSKISIEIKQNKENMEEKKLNLKPFDIQKAKEGKPVCTRDGRKARIICFDRKDIKPIVALVTIVNDTSITEKALYYFEDGHHLSKNDDNINDLMMLPEKKEGWVNLYRKDNHIITSKDVFCSEGGAIECVDDEGDGEYYISTIKISWEE